MQYSSAISAQGGGLRGIGPQKAFSIKAKILLKDLRISSVIEIEGRKSAFAFRIAKCQHQGHLDNSWEENETFIKDHLTNIITSTLELDYFGYIGVRSDLPLFCHSGKWNFQTVNLLLCSVTVMRSYFKFSFGLECISSCFGSNGLNLKHFLCKVCLSNFLKFKLSRGHFCMMYSSLRSNLKLPGFLLGKCIPLTP